MTFEWRDTECKVVSFSWTFLCSLVGIFYTTIYTSYLAKPGYEKLINTVEDFVENGLDDLLADWLSRSTLNGNLILQACTTVHLKWLQMKYLR